MHVNVAIDVMFLHLDRSHDLNLDMIWKGTHLSIKGLTADNTYQSENQAVKSKDLPAELRNWIVSRQDFWTFPKSTVVSIILKWKMFDTTRTLPRGGRPAKLSSNWWRRALSRLVIKNLMVILVELHVDICRWEKPTEGQTSLQQSTDLGFMAVWPNSILSSVKTHEITLGICKKHLKGTQTLRNSEKYYLVWLTSILSIMFEGNQICTSPAEYHPKNKVCWLQQGLGDWSGLRESWMGQSTEISSMKTCSTELRTSDWAEDSPSNMTMTLSTQPRQHRSGLGTTLWMS